MVRRAISSTILACLAGVVMWAGAAAAQGEIESGPDARTELGLVIYNQNFALVQERRTVELAAGPNRLAFTGISPLLEPGALILAGDGFEMLEQSSRSSGLTTQNVLQSSIGDVVYIPKINQLTRERTFVEAKVLNVQNGLVLEVDGRIEVRNGTPTLIAVDRLPEGLTATPVVRALVQSEVAGVNEADLTYLTGGMHWIADYVVTYEDGGDRLDLTALATITNLSGVDYQEAQVSLVAGSLSRAEILQKMRRLHRPDRMQGMAAVRGALEIPEQLPLGDQHVYPLDRRLNLADRETKQVSVLTARKVPFEREYRLPRLKVEAKGELRIDSQRRQQQLGPMKARSLLTFKNDADSGLGTPLPWGVVRVYERGARGRVLIGENSIANTPKRETVRIGLGEAFDITARGRRTAFKKLGGSDYEATFEFEIKNAKDSGVPVKVPLSLPAGWHIFAESAPHEQVDSNKLLWTVPVPSEGQGKLTITLRVVR